VSRLEIDPLYGADALARIFPFVSPGGAYAGRLSGFDTRGSDWIYWLTDLAFFDSNFVQLQVAGATIGAVEPGEFQRIELLVDGEKGTMRAFRKANTVRFYLPLLEENREVASGAIELKLEQRTPALTISANFLLADGQTLAIEPREWQFEKP